MRVTQDLELASCVLLKVSLQWPKIRTTANIQSSYPFSETNSQDFSRTQIDLSRAVKFTLTPTLSDLNVNPPYCLPFTSYYLVEFDIFPELSRTSGLFQDFPVLENARTFQVFQDPYKPCAL